MLRTRGTATNAADRKSPATLIWEIYVKHVAKYLGKMCFLGDEMAEIRQKNVRQKNKDRKM